VWAHDFAPAFNTAAGDVDCCVVIGVPNEATPATLEYCLRTSVAFVYATAHMSGLSRVGGVDMNERNSGCPGLVSKKTAKLGERP
jgi:hypothetical protein